MILFFFNDTATTEIYTLSLRDALPICATSFVLVTAPSSRRRKPHGSSDPATYRTSARAATSAEASKGEAMNGTTKNSIDRKSTRLNSSHANISYAVFCLKKQLQIQKTQ